MWRKMREVVISLKEAAGLSPNRINITDILSNMDATYIKDSYNSLSIEGYKVTEELLEKVRSGEWNPKKDARDKEQKDALAARGYYQAYQTLRTAISDTLAAGADAAIMYVKGHQSWHFQLFEPCIRAGFIKASDLIGYRTHQVYIRNSMHVPLNPDAVPDAMEALSEMMMEESDAVIRAILGHFFFVYIHPYMDGNGRTARFTMNSQLVTGGYPWVVVPLERREQYMKALEKASVEEEIDDFAGFVLSLL
jgi:Fic family protein